MRSRIRAINIAWLVALTCSLSSRVGGVPMAARRARHVEVRQVSWRGSDRGGETGLQIAPPATSVSQISEIAVERGRRGSCKVTRNSALGALDRVTLNDPWPPGVNFVQPYTIHAPRGAGACRDSKISPRATPACLPQSSLSPQSIRRRAPSLFVPRTTFTTRPGSGIVRPARQRRHGQTSGVHSTIVHDKATGAQLPWLF